MKPLMNTVTFCFGVDRAQIYVHACVGGIVLLRKIVSMWDSASGSSCHMVLGSGVWAKCCSRVGGSTQLHEVV